MTMNSKNISFQSNKLLTHFIDLDCNCFTTAEAIQVLSASASPSSIRELLSAMTKRGLLMRVRGGSYYIIPYASDPDHFMPDWHLLVKCMVKGLPHYIAYYSALQLHNLITQPALKEQIVVPTQKKPSTIRINNVSFQFIYHNHKHFFGKEKIWADSFNKVMCSDLEKTFIDCLFRPDYAGGIIEIAKALYFARKRINFEQLLAYSQIFNSQAVIKRLGFLLEILEIDQPIINELQKRKSNSYALLDTELPKAGKMISRWSIQQNIDSETIRSALFT